MTNKLLKLFGLLAVSYASLSAALVHVTSDITTNTTWTSNNEYVLEGITLVRGGATLTIQPGTVIRGQPKGVGFNPGTLVITRSGKINAVGTSSNPIIFTTAALNDGSGRPLGGLTNPVNATRATISAGAVTNGTFLDANPKTAPLPATYAGTSATLKMFSLNGGVIVLGKAPINVANQAPSAAPEEGFAYIEGLPETADTIYGGDFPLDSSGSMAYWSIRHGGAIIGTNNEINGLTLGGVGAGTTINNIDIYCNSDDGVEVFGGTVNMKYLNINYADDDGFDLDHGWTGSAQFVFTLQGLGYGDRGGEWDGDDEAANRVTANFKPLQYGVVSNFTVVNRGAGIGLNPRSGYGGEVLNGIVTGAATGVTIAASATGESSFNSAQSRALAGELVFKSVTVNGNTAAGGTFSGFDMFANTPVGNTSNSTANPGFRAFNHAVAKGINPVPLRSGAGGSPAAIGTVAAVPAGMNTVTYRGAFPATNGSLWTTGWTALNLRGILVSTGADL
ncbi:MAG: hypothetical protein MUE42_09285 [Opitutaceae bacterium]|jgi:hypothetical protein|nr:hypothetical protein [Opitutaceae bacterium]